MRIAPADIIASIIADMARPLPLSLHASFNEQDPASELCAILDIFRKISPRP